jgi:hypothetical protein
MVLLMIIVRIYFVLLHITQNCSNILGHFDLNAPNAELQKLVIAIDGPSKADIQIEVVDTGIYRVFYICQTPGEKINNKNFFK